MIWTNIANASSSGILYMNYTSWWCDIGGWSWKLRAYLYEQEATNESTALTVAHLGIMNRIGLHHIEQTLLTGRISKELIVRIGAIHVTSNDLLTRRLSLYVLFVLVLGVAGVRSAQILPGKWPQVDRYSLAYVLFELTGLLLGPHVPLGDYLIPQLPADLIKLRDLIQSNWI